MKSNKRAIALLLVAVSFMAVAFFWPYGDQPGTATNAPADQSRAERKARTELDWKAELRKRPDRKSLESIREKHLAMSNADAVANIEAFLNRGEDKETGLDFEIGAGGKLTGSPTLRVFLLDLLLEIDPAAAARISREILSKATTADEWAISLRNVARGEKGSANNEFLRSKAEELITNPEWQADPSVGYLNAFDVLVYTEATDSSPLLSGMIQNKDRRDLAHASFLTLDRLVQRAPVDMLTRLQSDSALQKSRPEMTAQQFARADLRDQKQQELVKRWLLDPTRTPTELRNFAGVYPNNNQMISQNLLTSEERIAGADLGTHDREVLPLIRAWRADPAFAAVSQYLEAMDIRVSGFVESSSREEK
jgi:hypothetical protein